MADIDIVQKRGSSVWLWIVLIVVALALLFWFMMAGGDTAAPTTQLQQWHPAGLGTSGAVASMMA